MRARLTNLGTVLAMAASAAAVRASAIAPGNLVIMQSIGDATVAAQTAVPVSLVEFSTAPSSPAIQTVNLATTGNTRLTIGAQTGTEGVLTYNDGYIGIAGYDADPGVANVFNGTTNSVRRMLGYDAKQDLAAGPQFNATTTIFNNGNFRSAIYSASAGGMYGIGAMQGVVFQPNGGTGTGANIVTTGGAALQGIGIYNGNVYGYQNGGSRGVYLQASGTPTSGPNSTSIFTPSPQAGNGGVAVTGYNFWISPDQNTVYIAEDTDSGTGGIKKYTRPAGGSFSLAYTIKTDYDGEGSAVTGVKSIAVDTSGANPIFYATTSDRMKVITIMDMGTAEASAPTLSVLQTAEAGNLIRSVVFVPHVPGDANDDGLLTGDDYTLTDKGYGRYTGGLIAPGATVWSDGDFNHDGAIDAADYMIIDRAYAASHGQLEPGVLDHRLATFGQGYVDAFLASVPEPTGMVAALIPALGLLRRRRAMTP